ncbi:hypothetical protein [Amycolatopsis sp. PS_44_ISF1]|uniref:hypothetical protein n=1 Tax=Amycolatopsis sp. PS_44_ISF1 TaxID=2974917 RepID=UPI0028DFB17F|nr:hypothetical protein [Amycolatopsis sp. PS_44_ISF1]MDT8911900.1 hypothetical protein [Amycolatopsis sp. PS_44_ISF1]
MDLLPLLEADHRVQVLFTVPHTTDAWHGVEDYVRAQRGVVLPWQQAMQHEFDLVLAASHRQLDELRGPIFLVPHGAGALMSRRFSRKARAATAVTTGLDRELLTFRGRVLPAALALTHDAELEVLRERCPEAVPVAFVGGDICADRMLAGLPHRARYRAALGIGAHERLVTVSSTWSPDSAFGRFPTLCRRLLDNRSTSTGRVAAVLHPNVWTVHGARQVTAWLSDCLRDGLLLVPPDEGWQAVMIASDWVLGDHGSTTAYAAAIGCPVSVVTTPAGNVRDGSLADLVRRSAPEWHPGGGMDAQYAAARSKCAGLERMLLPAITSRPEKAAALMRVQMYRLLGLPEPEAAASALPVSPPRPMGR